MQTYRSGGRPRWPFRVPTDKFQERAARLAAGEMLPMCILCSGENVTGRMYISGLTVDGVKLTKDGWRPPPTARRGKGLTDIYCVDCDQTFNPEAYESPKNFAEEARIVDMILQS